jgi:hypothetical protein
MDIFDNRPKPREIKRWSRLILAAGVLLALILAMLFAPPLAAFASAQGLDAGRVEVISPAGANIKMEVNKGRLVRLLRPASTVFIADPRIADVQVTVAGLSVRQGIGRDDPVCRRSGRTGAGQCRHHRRPQSVTPA